MEWLECRFSADQPKKNVGLVAFKVLVLTKWPTKTRNYQPASILSIYIELLV